LYRSSTERLAGGVAGGLAHRFGVPVLLVRVGFVLAAFFGIGFPLYVLAWVLLPNDRGERVMGHGPVRDLLTVGAVLVAGLMLFAEFDDVDYWSVVGRTLPWLVILGGLVLLLRRADGASSRSPGVSAPPPPPPAADASSVSPLAPPPPPPSYPVAVASPVVGPPRPLPSPPASRSPRPPRPRPVIGPLTWCVALLAVGAMGLVELVDGSDSTTVGPGPLAAVVMIVFGLGLTLSAFRGRARGLILPALALAVGLAGLTALDVRADTVAGPFDLRISDESKLPDDVESAVGSNTFDVRELELTSNRTIGIRQTAGTLRINLPRTTTTKVLVHVGTGDARVERPSARNALYDPAQSQRWIDNGLPESGETLSAADLRRAINGYWGTTTRDVDRSGGVVSVDQGSDHTLVIDVELGLGSLTILDPRWSDVPDRVVQPVQLCTVGGGARGVVEDCPDVPVDRRVALCLNDSGFLVDCREDRPGTFDFPRVAACRGFDGEYRSCDELGIEPVGAELISPVDPNSPPEATIAPVGSSDPSDPTGTSDPSVAVEERATVSTTPGTAPPDTVDAPSPQATVPAPVPVPTTVGG
jgi:phage shock protein PspC (stress-responsive transcriptional regulator)